MRIERSGCSDRLLLRAGLVPDAILLEHARCIGIAAADDGNRRRGASDVNGAALERRDHSCSGRFDQLVALRPEPAHCFNHLFVGDQRHLISARMNMLYLSKQSVGPAGEGERRMRYDNNV